MSILPVNSMVNVLGAGALSRLLRVTSHCAPNIGISTTRIYATVLQGVNCKVNVLGAGALNRLPRAIDGIASLIETRLTHTQGIRDAKPKLFGSVLTAEKRKLTLRTKWEFVLNARSVGRQFIANELL